VEKVRKSELGIGQQVTTSHPTGKVSRTWHGATGELAGCPCMYEMSVSERECFHSLRGKERCCIVHVTRLEQSLLTDWLN